MKTLHLTENSTKKNMLKIEKCSIVFEFYFDEQNYKNKITSVWQLLRIHKLLLTTTLCKQTIISCQAAQWVQRKGKRQKIRQLEPERVVAVFILNYLTPWLWVKCRERHWEIVEAFIKCSSGPGETLVNVPIISGVVQHPALCPNDSCLMHLCSPCHLTSPPEVVGWGGTAKAPARPTRGKAPCSYSLPALHLLNMGRAAPCLPYCWVISPELTPTPSHCMNLNSRVVWLEYVALWRTLLLPS